MTLINNKMSNFNINTPKISGYDITALEKLSQMSNKINSLKKCLLKDTTSDYEQVIFDTSGLHISEFTKQSDSKNPYFPGHPSPADQCPLSESNDLLLQKNDSHFLNELNEINNKLDKLINQI